MFRRNTQRIVLLSALLIALAVPGFAQEAVTHASITGHVADPTGAVIPNALVTALQIATNQSFSTTTDGQGRFHLAYLPVGKYQLTARANGFMPKSAWLALSVGAAFDITLQLPIPTADIGDEVSVPLSLVEEDRSQISETVLQTETTNLPLEGRNYLDLALLVPGVSPTNTASTQTLAETSEVVGQGYSVNSQRNFSNSFVVDGLSANDDAAGVAGNSFSLDVVQEFQVITSGGQAEFGRALGGYFNIITRSGANQLHGTAYGFLRNQRLNAANALSRTTLPLTQGQYGGSLSGPLRKDSTFLFGNFEEQRLRTNGIITVTPANASAINALLASAGYGGSLLPVGTSATTQYPTTLHTDTAFLRADHRFGQGGQLSVRYSFYNLSSLNARGNGGLNEISNGTSVFDTNHTVALSSIATLSAHIYNETRAQFVHDDLSAPPNDTTGPAVTVSGVAIFGRSTSSPTSRLNGLGELVDNVVLERGAHTFKAGADFLINDDTITYPQAQRGSYSFACLYTTGTAPAGQTGCANGLSTGNYNAQGFTQNFGSPTVQQRNPNIGMYIQDEWKATSSLTLNLGLRYDLEFLQTIQTDASNVSPRVGFAWSPFASHATVIRGSYGLFYDRVPLRPLANALLSANNTIGPAQARFLSYSFSATDSNAPMFPAVATAPPPGAKPNYATMDAHIQNPYSQQASLAIEQQLGSASLGVSYQHLRGEHLISSYNTNINLDGTRPDATRGNIKPYSSVFDSYFDGLELSFLQRPRPWGAMRVSYTWSKAIDDVGEFFFSSPINNFDFRVDRSRSDDDQRHRLAFDAGLTSQTGTARNVAGHITHGWRLGGILQYYSRLPFNITTGANTKQATSQRPCAPGYSLSANGGVNPCTEALRGAVTGRNAGVGFDFFTLNARLSRSFALTERLRLETMAEAFNALNHRNDLVPNGTFGTGAYPSMPNPVFGQATAVGDPRNVQLAARFSF